jgi:site-specific DNA-methyltransferase (cytosine-N4-specific)
VQRNVREDLERTAFLRGFPTVGKYLLSLHEEQIRKKHIARVPDREESRAVPTPMMSTRLGDIFHGDSVSFMEGLNSRSVDLILTSPPFGLVYKKDYGNEDADRYVEWFRPFAAEFARILKPNGSLVIDIGGAWKKGQPTRSLYHYELAISLCREFGFHLAQEIYWWNPAKLPSPAEWVTVRRIRLKDAVNCIWWLSRTPYPKASNRRVLQAYSQSMQNLLKNGYKPGKRPSGHNISANFNKDNGGAIPPNLVAVANTESQGSYQKYCRQNGLPEHPARFPAPIPSFFIRMLTNRGDVVFDPFAGSCMTGAVAEALGRRWLCCEIDETYVAGAIGRFKNGSIRIQHSDEPYRISPPSLSIEADVTPLPDDGGICPARTLREKPTSPGRRAKHNKIAAKPELVG